MLQPTTGGRSRCLTSPPRISKYNQQVCRLSVTQSALCWHSKLKLTLNNLALWRVWITVLKQKKKCVPPELPVLADGHHDQQVSQDAHQHDQRQEADQSHPLWHAVAMETRKRHHHNNKSVWICREKHIVQQCETRC